VSRSRYLVVKLSAVGDVAMASTLPGAIRTRDPEAHVTWLCGRRVADLVRLYDSVDDVVTVDEVNLLRGATTARITEVLALWATLLPRRFDVTLVGHADRRYRTLLGPLRTGRMRALDLASGLSMLPVPGRYFGDEYVRLLDEAPARGPIAGHWPLADVRPRLRAPARADEIGVVLAPGGARNILRESALKRWPVERYRDVAAQLLESGHCVTLVGDAGDTWVRPYFAGLPVRDEIGRHDLPGTLALLNQSELVVVHDTGILHLARLVRVPVLALFGPTNPAQFIVEAPDVTILWGGARLACRPCYDGREFAACSNNLCMQDIAVGGVVQHAERMLASGRRDQRLARERS
jgi:heptosyltransferase II